MEAIAKTDPHSKPINFARNFGQQVSTTAGLTFCKGDYAFIIIFTIIIVLILNIQ